VPPGLSVPAAFVHHTIAREGGRGREWLDQLPDLVADLCTQWNLQSAGHVAFGAVALVVPVRSGTSDAVLKVSFPHPGNVGEVAALTAFDGQGAVRLLDADPQRFALLLERTYQGDLTTIGDVDEALHLAGQIARRLAIPAPSGTEHISKIARSWGAELLAQHRAVDPAERLPERTVETAMCGFDDFAADTTSTLIHGDLHFGNILRAQREPWLAIDPTGLAGSACFDAASVIRDGLPTFSSEPSLRDLLARRIGIFSNAADVDATLSMTIAQARFASSYYWDLASGSPTEVIAGMRSAAIATTGLGQAA
jgi:streptomycin 6-kinase